MRNLRIVKADANNQLVKDGIKHVVVTTLEIHNRKRKHDKSYGTAETVETLLGITNGEPRGCIHRSYHAEFLAIPRDGTEVGNDRLDPRHE